MEIRPARPDEFAALGQLTLEAYRTVGPQSAAYEAELVDVAHRAEHATVLVAADDDGTPLGCVTLVLPGPNVLSEHREPEAASIRMLGVAPGARGRGIGEALTLAAMEEARAVGATAMVLHSATDMAAAHRLYRRLGFVRDEALDWVPEPDVELLGFRLAL
ncbi:GNAT family N-acetyltransferase [Acidimicrobiia bacterium EGI L10123]|uniref:GNAT family N-acetyltransferase n=1 Tax=Salinilacustrithrix flava TaxID=2957203 RepID=UPI003D7C2C18|nr:GNAT family N-acetyltransferase [Acidimicrobiia bacterium EGI L10123]